MPLNGVSDQIKGHFDLVLGQLPEVGTTSREEGGRLGGRRIPFNPRCMSQEYGFGEAQSGQ